MRVLHLLNDGPAAEIVVGALQLIVEAPGPDEALSARAS